MGDADVHRYMTSLYYSNQVEWSSHTVRMGVYEFRDATPCETDQAANCALQLCHCQQSSSTSDSPLILVELLRFH
jgi:hypothetical protein